MYGKSSILIRRTTPVVLFNPRYRGGGGVSLRHAEWFFDHTCKSMLVFHWVRAARSNVTAGRMHSLTGILSRMFRLDSLCLSGARGMSLSRANEEELQAWQRQAFPSSSTKQASSTNVHFHAIYTNYELFAAYENSQCTFKTSLPDEELRDALLHESVYPSYVSGFATCLKTVAYQK